MAFTKPPLGVYEIASSFDCLRFLGRRQFVATESRLSVKRFADAFKLRDRDS